MLIEDTLISDLNLSLYDIYRTKDEANKNKFYREKSSGNWYVCFGMRPDHLNSYPYCFENEAKSGIIIPDKPIKKVIG